VSKEDQQDFHNKMLDEMAKKFKDSGMEVVWTSDQLSALRNTILEELMEFVVEVIKTQLERGESFNGLTVLRTLGLVEDQPSPTDVTMMFSVGGFGCWLNDNMEFLSKQYGKDNDLVIESGKVQTHESVGGSPKESIN